MIAIETYEVVCGKRLPAERNGLAREFPVEESDFSAFMGREDEMEDRVLNNVDFGGCIGRERAQNGSTVVHTAADKRFKEWNERKDVEAIFAEA